MYTYDVDRNFSGMSGTCLLLALPLLCEYYWQVFWCSLVPSCNYDAENFKRQNRLEFYNAFQLMNDISASLTASGNDHLYAKIQASVIRMHHVLRRQGHAVISRAMWIYWTFRGLMECHKFGKCLVKGECLCIACWSVSLPWARHLKACS